MTSKQTRTRKPTPAEATRRSSRSTGKGGAERPGSASTEPPAEIDLTLEEEEGAGSTLGQFRAEVADALEERVGEVEEGVWAAIRRQVPAYSALARDPTTAEEVRASVGAIVRVFVDLVREARSFSDDEFALMRDVGRRRAEQGLTADHLHRAAHVALKVGLRHLRADVRALGVTDATFDAAGAIAESLHDYVNEFTSAAGTGVREVQERRANDRADERAEVVSQILDGAHGDPRAIQDATAALGHPLTAPCTLLLVSPSRVDGPRSLAGPMSILLRDQDALRSPVRLVPIPHAVAITSHDGRGSVSDLLRQAHEVATASDLVVVVDHIVNLSELAATYQWVCELLAVPVGFRSPGVTEIEDLAPHWLIGDLPAGVDFLFAQRIVGPLLACRDDKIRDRAMRAIRHYFAADGSIEDTAEALSVDRRTAERHLKEFEELTGRSVRAPSQQLLIQHALHLLELKGTFPDPGDAAWAREPQLPV